MKRYGISLSVGVASFGEAQDLPFDHALALADAACFLAKENGRNRVQLATPSDEAVLQQHRDMDSVSLIKQAIRDDRIALVAQKIVGLSKQGEAPMYEVLARIRDVDGVYLAPSSFISAAERFGLIEELDHHIIRQAMAHIAEQADHSQPATYFINVSGITLGSASFPCFIDGVLNEFSCVDARRICFEVTETAAVANVRVTSAAMQELTKRGFRFALDDFGSGMASFSYLQKLPVAFVKIDGQFVRSMLDEATNAAIVDAVVKVARAMNIATIAETVDRQSLLPILRNMRVDFAQGFALHEPEPIGMVTRPSTET